MKLGVEAAPGEVREGLPRLFKSLLAVAERDGATTDDVLAAVREALSPDLLIKAERRQVRRPMRATAVETAVRKFETYYSDTLLPRMIEDITNVVEQGRDHGR